MSTARRRWGFRTRLTALIAAVFVTGGVVLLGVQYLLVQGLFDNAIGSITGCVDEHSVVVVTVDDIDEAECQAIIEASGAVDGTTITMGDDGYGVLIEQTTMLSREVLSGLLLWSIVTLLVFTGVAVAAASWLSRRSFARIGQITDTTKRITRNDLHQRLGLPGPADEIKELGDTIDTMLDGLEASFMQQERFITNASHELRTPLTTTRAALEIPLTQGHVPEHLEPAIRRALDANQRSEHLIAALLQLARATTAGPAAGDALSQTELVPIIEQSLAERRNDIDGLRLTVTTEVTTATALVADDTLLALAIDNLIDNAIRHNTRRGALHISTGQTDGKPWLEITNSGAVFGEEDAARLTEPFNRGPRTRTTSDGRSLGLGLTLVQSILDSLGATLTLGPGPDGGLVVRVGFS